MNIKIVGVCDVDLNARGLELARQLGIYVTDDFRNLFKLPDLGGILELTNNEDALLELIRLRPKGVGIMEHNIGRLLRSLFEINTQLQQAEHQVVIEKMVSKFLMEHAKAAIVILNTDFTIADCNDVYLDTVKKEKQEVIGTFCYKVMHGLNVPCSSAYPDMGCPLIETLRTGEAGHAIHEYPDSQGHTVFDNLVTYPIKDKGPEQ